MLLGYMSEYLYGITGRVVSQGPLTPGYGPQLETIRRVFHVTFRLITFECRSAHSAYYVHESVLTNSMLIYIYYVCQFNYWSTCQVFFEIHIRTFESQNIQKQLNYVSYVNKDHQLNGTLYYRFREEGGRCSDSNIIL